MSFYPSAGSTDEALHHYFDDQSSATQFDARSRQQQQDHVFVFSTQVDLRPHYQFDGRARVDAERQHQCDQGTSNTLSSESWQQNEIDKIAEVQCHSSNTLFRGMQQRAVGNRNAESQLLDRTQVRQLENQNPSAQLGSGWSAPLNDSSELPPVRLPTFIYREPLPPYVPDKSSPEEYHGKVVSPGSIRLYTQPGMLVDHELPPLPPSYIGWSIVSMLFCCLPLGIAAVVASSGVSTAYEAGRYDEAQSKSASARSLNIAGTVLGVVVLVVTVIINITSFAGVRAVG